MILIKGAEIIDGSGKPAARGDSLIQDEKISAIGNFPNKSADVIIDGLGYQLTPGFIDVNTDSDHYLSLFTNPPQKDFLLQGVTTIIGGNCGSSLAPLLYGSLESIRKWTNINQVNVDWHTMAEFFKVLGRAPIGVNFGTLVGHSTIRRAILGEEIRDLSANELEVFKKTLKQALEEGAFGLSSGLGYVHTRQTPYDEIKALAEIVKAYDGVYATHLRNERENLNAAVIETIKATRETGVRTIISHFRPLIGYEEGYQESLKLLEEITDLDIHFDFYPFDMSVIPLYTMLPLWAQTKNLEMMVENLKNSDLKAKILAEVPPPQPDDIVVSYAEGANYLAGKTIGQLAENYAFNTHEALVSLMLLTKLKAVIFYRNINLEMVLQAMANPRALISSNAASIVESKQMIKHERFYNTFPKFLEIILGNKSLPLEAAIQKITSTPAQIMNLKQRGLVKEGYFADLVMLKDGKVSNVFINGRVAVRDGQAQNILAGKILKRS